MPRPPIRSAPRAPFRATAPALPALAAALAAPLLIAACSQTLKLAKDDSPLVLAHQTIAAPNPADAGPFKVLRLYYGPGTDKQRSEFRDSVKLKTRPVDISPFATVQPAQVNDRKKYWGFDMKKVPLNGRVWYPEGDGPFPLVLVVHGNHNPRDYSDPGYGYLGELLASRGFILVSVDENFINGLSGENDGRAWLLLKHLQEWKRFNDSTGSPFHHRVDLDNIAIMGHSRGGEAVGHAAAFNRLKYFPDDAKQKFDFGFNIRAVVAIAPVDGQYRPSSQLVPVENVNYLLLHGSHDGDVSTFVGLRTYERLRFTDGKPWFKAAIYMYRANHGQWNTVWNNKDNGPRSGRSLDLRALIAPEEQRQFGKLVISAFLETTLHGKREYLPMFRDHRTAGAWFPKTMYVTRFEEHGYRPLAEFDEDVDLTTGTARGVTIADDSLATWKENVLPFRWRGTDDQRNNGVWIGWNNRIAGTDTTKYGKPASYAITLPDTLAGAWRVSDQSALYLSLAPTKDKPGTRAEAKDTTKKDSTKADSAKKKPAPKPKPPPKKKEEADTIPLDLTVELVDAAGNAARLPLSRFGAVRRPLETRIYRRQGRDETRFQNIFELVLQTYVLPLADFAKAAPQFQPGRLKTIRLLFDRTCLGTVVLDDVGISPAMNPAFRAGELP